MDIHDQYSPDTPTEEASRLEAAFLRQARLTPDAIAILRNGRQITYGGLEALSAGMASLLGSQGLGRLDRVAIAFPRSIEMVAAMLAALRCGCTYVPIDLKLPPERIAFILEDSGIGAIFLPEGSDAPVLANAYGARLKIVWKEEADKSSYEAPSSGELPPDDPAYVIYTSGSTGRPKGVVLSHEVCHYLRSSAEQLSRGTLTMVAAVTSVAFDPSIFEIYAPLMMGGTILLKDHALEPFSDEEKPTLFQGVPSALRQLVRAGAIPDSVQVINSGGETLTRELADEVYARTAISQLYNHYGPTEASVCATIYPVPRIGIEAPTAGRPVGKTHILLRDTKGDPVPHGEIGEIFIGGPGLAHGYTGDASLANDRFVIDGHTGERVYRTGDMGRFRENGELELHGRVDEQAKLRGQRVDLAHVDTSLANLPGVVDAGSAIVRREDGPDLLCGFVALEQLDGAAGREKDAESLTSQLSDKLRAHLPDLLVPHRIMAIEAIPRLISGKVDRAALEHLAAQAVFTQTADLGGIDDLNAACAIFALALGLPDFQSDQDIFASGADSLMAVQVALQLQEKLGRYVPVNLIAHHPSPRALLNALGELQSPDRLLTIEGNPGGRPLFFAPCIRGDGSDYESLKPLFAERRICQLNFLPLVDEIIVGRELEAMGRKLAEVVAQEQPSGDIDLIGYSFGGLAAFAIARALEDNGRRTRLVMIDADIPRTTRSVRRWGGWLAKEVLPACHDNGLRHTMRRLFRSLEYWWSSAIPLLRRSAIPTFLSNEDQVLMSALIQMVARYCFPQHRAPTLLLVATRMDQSARLRNPDMRNGWEGVLIGEFQVTGFPVTHGEMNRGAGLAPVSENIRHWLAQEPVR